MEPKPVYNTPPTQQRAAPARTATVTLPVDVLHVVHAVQFVRNRVGDEVIVRVLDLLRELDGQHG